VHVGHANVWCNSDALALSRYIHLPTDLSGDAEKTNNVTEVIDVKVKGKRHYGLAGCVGLALTYKYASSASAVKNADNYRLFAEAAYYTPRKWATP